MTTVTPATDVDKIPIAKIHSPGNIRRTVGDTSELEASIQAVGLLEPVLVRDLNGDGYELIAGHRRLAAVTNLGEDTILSRILPASDEGELHRITVQLVENLQRVDLDPLEEAAGYAQLKEYGWKQRQIAKSVGRSEGHVSKRLALLALPDRAIDLHEAGKLGAEALYELTRVASAGGDLTPILDDIDELDPSDPYAEPITVVDVRHMADDAVKDANARGDLEKRSAELTAQGVTVVEGRDVDVPKGHKRVGWAFDVDVDKHRAEPCAVVYLHVQWGRVYELDVCSDPNRHTPDGESKLKAKPDPYAKSEKEKAKEERERQQTKERHKALTAAMSSAMEGRTPARDKIVERMAVLYLENVWAEVSKRAIKLLDLDSELGDDYRGLAGLYESATTQDRNRILLALTLADGHTRATGGWSSSSAFDRQVEYLVELGVDVDFGGSK